jgi:lipopolysaccharide export system permease protein
LLGLGNLAVHRELVVMRASGVSQYRLLAAVGAAGAILIVVMLLLGESLAPKLGDYARRARTEALLDNVNAASAQPRWLNEGEGFLINLRQPGDGESFEQVQVLELDGDSGILSIARGELISGACVPTWELIDFAETRFSAEGTTPVRQDRLERNFGFSQDICGLSDQRVDLLPLGELQLQIDRYQSRGLDATRFIAEYWGRIANGVSVLIMALLALPFVLGSLRSADAGARMIIGLVIGLGYYVLGEVSASGGQVFALDPVVAAWVPSGALLVFTALVVVRLR